MKIEERAMRSKMRRRRVKFLQEIGQMCDNCQPVCLLFANGPDFLGKPNNFPESPESMGWVVGVRIRMHALGKSPSTCSSYPYLIMRMILLFLPEDVGCIKLHWWATDGHES